MSVRISVILPNYNHAEVVGRAIACFLGQTRPPDELIVIDDASTDDSVECISTAIDGAAQARLLRHDENRGVAETLNHGIAEATGDWLLLGAADDAYDPHMLEWLAAPLARHPGVGLVCGNAVQREGEANRSQRVPLPFGDAPRLLDPAALIATARRRNFLFSTGACLISRRALKQAGALDPALRWHCDWVANFVVAFRHGAFFVPRDVLFLEAGPATYSAGRSDREAQRRVIRAVATKLAAAYPDVLPAFRRAALLPTYECGSARMLLASSETRPMVTPLLLWRLASYRALQRIGRLAPPAARARLRQFLRV